MINIYTSHFAWIDYCALHVYLWIFYLQPPPSKVPNAPAYNQLDKPTAPPALNMRTKKFPYSKQEKITTTEMQKVKKSTVGVLPNSRLTTDLQDLNLLMEGQLPKPPNADSDHPIDMVQSVNVLGGYGSK